MGRWPETGEFTLKVGATLQLSRRRYLKACAVWLSCWRVSNGMTNANCAPRYNVAFVQIAFRHEL
jgi:hypothetical protein